MSYLRTSATVGALFCALFVSSSAIGQTQGNGFVGGYTTMGGIGGAFGGANSGALAGAPTFQPTPQTPAAVSPPAAPASSDRVSVMNLAASGKASVPIPMDRVAALCADLDGCQVRLGRQDAASDGVIEFISTVWFLNPSTGNWRTERGSVGKDANNVNDNVLRLGTCFFGDGERDEDGAFTDITAQFGVFSTAEPVAATTSTPAVPPTEDCVVTLIN